ncbi:MAG: calcium-binding protein [Planctomycetota bacterium]|jgi:hypothetical protein
MRILLAVPHFYAYDPRLRYGSCREAPEARAEALARCLRGMHSLFGRGQHFADLTRPVAYPANELTRGQIDVVVCTVRDKHVLKRLASPKGAYAHHTVDGDPWFLGYECHAVLQSHLGEHDYYGYMEDDLVVHDPWFFIKLQHFTRQVGDDSLLQPNRYESARGTLSGKAYIDGDLPPEATAPYQDVSDRSEAALSCLGIDVLCRRPRNPHSGCFFLNGEQMARWSREPHFLDRDASFYSPLESAATLGVMRTFRIYKPVRQAASFLEIEHAGDAWIRKLAAWGGRSTSVPV